MTMKVTMNIKGDAVIYEEPNAWHITFITDECHTMKFSADGVPVDSLRKAGVTRYINIIANNPVTNERSFGTDFDKILNFNHPNLHGLTDGKSNLFTRQNSGPGRELIHMTCPVGVVSGEDLVAYWYAKYPGGEKHDLDHPVARVIKIDFELAEESDLSIELKDETGSWTFDYPYKKNLTLEFDNDCQEISTEIDFLHYYDWVWDKRSTPTDQIRFIAGKKSSGAAPESATCNCDPGSISPPPQGG